MKIRQTVIFLGRVQGVGFRWNVVESVGDSPVTGSVRNLGDGSVEAIFEGDADAIEGVLMRIRQRMAEHIASERVAGGPATGEFRGFEIRR